MRHHQITLLITVLALLLSACASSGDPFMPGLEGNWQDRIQTQSKNGLTVSAAVPSAKETKELFGTNLYKKNVQPVWLKISNERTTGVNFLPIGIDPSYYTPIEVANIDVNLSGNNSTDPIVDKRFFESKIGNYVEPESSISGFIFTRIDEGTKAFNVDISDENKFDTFTFFVPVPGLNIDHYQVDWRSLYPADQFVDISEPDELIERLESLPCCVKDKAGENTGDPLNIAVIGRPIDVYYAFIRANWDETETVDRVSLWKTAKSFIGGGEYRYSPVSSLYVFDRPQDVAFQMARDNIHERNHLRLWMTPMRFQDVPVWIGQISRDIGVRFTKKTITTHKIDPDVDETRESLLENLVYNQALKKFAYVEGVGEVSILEPRGNLTGDPWFTDGHRLVLWLTSEPVALNDLDYELWRLPADRR